MSALFREERPEYLVVRFVPLEPYRLWRTLDEITDPIMVRIQTANLRHVTFYYLTGQFAGQVHEWSVRDFLGSFKEVDPP